MKRYSVILSPRALGQLGEIEQWIESETGDAIARRYRLAITAFCQQLEYFPHRGRSRDDLRDGLQTIVFRRSVTIGFEVKAETVIIVAILGRGRDLASALET